MQLTANNYSGQHEGSRHAEAADAANHTYCLSRCSRITLSETEARVAVESGGGGLGPAGRGAEGRGAEERGAAGGLLAPGLASPTLNS